MTDLPTPEEILREVWWLRSHEEKIALIHERDEQIRQQERVRVREVLLKMAEVPKGVISMHQTHPGLIKALVTQIAIACGIDLEGTDGGDYETRRDLRAEAKRRLASRKNKVVLVQPSSPPRYDQVFFEGQTIFDDDDGNN